MADPWTTKNANDPGVPLNLSKFRCPREEGQSKQKRAKEKPKKSERENVRRIGTALGGARWGWLRVIEGD